MTPAEARAHAEHLCDVYPSDPGVEHIGVIDRIRNGAARVTGHPQYGERWFRIADLSTSCKVPVRTGYVCKRCGGPSPIGVGYAADAVDAPDDIASCECGYSRKP